MFILKNCLSPLVLKSLVVNSNVILYGFWMCDVTKTIPQIPLPKIKIIS